MPRDDDTEPDGANECGPDVGVGRGNHAADLPEVAVSAFLPCLRGLGVREHGSQKGERLPGFVRQHVSESGQDLLGDLFCRPAQLRRRTPLRDALSGDTEAYADLFAPEAVIEWPFAGGGMPPRLEGQQAVREFTRRVAASPWRISDLEETAVHHTSDPEVVIVELVAKGTVGSTGGAFTTTSIQVFRIREGKILLFRDYANPRVLGEALGD